MNDDVGAGRVLHPGARTLAALGATEFGRLGKPGPQRSAGILLGLVGAGGSILAVPVLVYVFGEPVNIAARVLSVAEPREVCFTEAVFLAMNRAAEAAVPMGQQALVSAVKTMTVDDARAASWAVATTP